MKQIQCCNIGTCWLTSKYAWEYRSCEFYNLEILILLSSICPIAKQEGHAHKHRLQTQNVRSHLECCVQFWALLYKGTWHWQTEVSPTKGHLDGKELRHLSCEESLTESWFCSVCRREVIAVFRSVMAEYREVGMRLSLKVRDGKRRGNGHKLQQGKFWLNIGKLFPMKVITSWKRGPGILHRWRYPECDWTAHLTRPGLSELFEADDLQMSLPTYIILSFCDHLNGIKKKIPNILVFTLFVLLIFLDRVFPIPMFLYPHSLVLLWLYVFRCVLMQVHWRISL